MTQRHPLLERLGYHAEQVRAWGSRSQRVSLVMRGIVWVTGAAALVTAAPDAVLPLAALVVAAALAGAAAAWPGTGWVSGLELGAVGLLAMSVGQQGGIGLPAVGALAILLYLHHSAAALAAHLRTDTLVPVAVLWHWARRAGAVLGGSAVVWVGVALVPQAAPAWPPTVPMVLGALAVLAVTAVLLYQVRRGAHPPDRADQGLVQRVPFGSGMNGS
jgi:hypothetical protein